MEASPAIAALGTAAARLSAAHAACAAAARASIWQDGLDLLATAAGLKPVCVLGRGDTPPGWLALARTIAHDLGLSAIADAGWHPAGTFPAWYETAIAPHHAGLRVVYLYRDAATAPVIRARCAARRVTPADETALLGYPACCVAHHHDQALAFERLALDMIVRLCGSDTARRDRLVAAGVVPTPCDAAEWQRWDAATMVAPQPWTSVNRCPDCVADPSGPAAALGARYRALALALDYDLSALAA